jgi:hypothetical protein
MEPRKEENEEPRKETTEAKPRRFRIVRLEERIAPGGGNGNGSKVTCGQNFTCGKCGGYC